MAIDKELSNLEVGKKKNRTVSKAEFDKSGYKTLRDFMNARKYDDATGRFIERAKPLTKRKDDMVLSAPTAREMEKGYTRMPTKRKVPTVSMQELADSKMDLNTFMNSHKYDGKKYIPRDIPLVKKTPNIKNIIDKYEADTVFEDDKPSLKKGGSVKPKSASSRGDGCAQRGRTRG
jgi:hypothetical protein